MRINLTFLFVFVSLCTFSQLDKSLSSSSVISYDTVETQPEYPGGIEELQKFVVSNMELPELSRFGTILISFVVDSDGSVKDYTVVKDLGNDSGNAIIEVLKKAKRWKPGDHKGIPSKVRVNFPIKIAG